MSGAAFVFPGQGSQSVGMGMDLVLNFPAAKLVFEEASDATGMDLLRLCKEGPAEELNRTEVTQPAILTASMAAYRVLSSETEIRPVMVAGHSLGEYTALTAAGGFALCDAAPLARRRGRFMQEAVPEGKGAMAAVLGMELGALEALCREVDGLAVPANLNCPGQIVISGEAAAVEAVIGLVRERGGKRAVLLPVSGPFHSPLMEPAAERLQEVLGAIEIGETAVPVVNNADAETVRTPQQIRNGLVRQLTAPVRWEEGVRRMLAEGVTCFIEVGPGRVLSNLIRRINRDVQVWHLQDTEGLKAIQKAPVMREV
jgi:[acyl-carrier-protein] S-malonyltransferase